MQLLIYGAYGFAGRLITEVCVERGLPVRVAGRDEAQVRRLAKRWELPHATFELEDRPALDETLAEVDVVLSCAGPFQYTAQRMVEACMRTETHYLDITGELGVFEQLADQDMLFQQAGIAVVPGVGFDVVPSDCLGAHLYEQLPSANRIELAVIGSSDTSRGTARTALEQLGQPGYIRAEGRLQPVPPAWKSLDVPLDGRIRKVTSVQLADVATAYRSTGIRNIVGYAALPELAVYMLRLSRYLGWLFQWEPVRLLLRRWVDATYVGPDEAHLEKGRSYVWGRVENAEGASVVGRMRCPDAYALTARTAAIAAERILSENVDPGFHTPVTAFGKDMVFDVEAVEIEIL